MSRHEYAALPSQRASSPTPSEMEMVVFQIDDEEDQDGEATPLNRVTSDSEVANTRSAVATPIPGTYESESNHEENSTPVTPTSSTLAAAGPALAASLSRQNIKTRLTNFFRGTFFFRKAVGTILPSHYARVPTAEEAQSSRPRIRGSGIENDGVFANVVAKPTVPRTVQDENGNVYVMPEEAQSTAPPVSPFQFCHGTL